MSEKFDYILDDEDPSINEVKEPRKKSPKWYIVTDGSRVYDKIEDTIKPYGFPRGSDTFNVSSSNKVSDERSRDSFTYVEPIKY